MSTIHNQIRALTEDKAEPETGEQPDEPTEDNPTDRTEPATPKVAPYKQPTGAHDAYGQGERVTYRGATWESTIPANVWSPDTYPQGWKKI